MRASNNMAWSGDAGSIIFWDGRMAAVRQLEPGDEFKLFGWTWRVRRQAGRTTFADGTGTWEGCSIQLKHSRLVEVPVVVHAEQNTHSSPRWGAGGNPEQGEWAKDASAQTRIGEALILVDRVGFGAYNERFTRAERSQLRDDFAALVEQLESLHRAFEKYADDWDSVGTTEVYGPDMAAEIRKTWRDAYPASGVGDVVSVITGDGSGEALPPIVEVGEQPLRTSSPVSSSERGVERGPPAHSGSAPESKENASDLRGVFEEGWNGSVEQNTGMSPK